MKVFLTAVICGILLLGSMASAGSIWGYVYDDEVEVDGATVFLKELPDGEPRLTTTNIDGYYVFPNCWEGNYGMEAWKGQKNDLQWPIYHSGGAGGKQVDFHLTYDPK